LSVFFPRFQCLASGTGLNFGLQFPDVLIGKPGQMGRTGLDLFAGPGSGVLEDIIRAETAALDTEGFDKGWGDRIEELSKLAVGARTHIAFMGVALVAKATNPAIDLYAIKPDHDPDNPRSYPARSVGEDVLVPMAAELAFHLGVTARQPLNNMPYFRISRIGDNTAMSKRGRIAYNYVLELVKELDAEIDDRLARKALRAYIAVRRQHQPKYAARAGDIRISPDKLAEAADRFVRENSEGGRRAQAVVAGLMDAVVGPDRVESGRVNDPSRKYPGDVCIHVSTESDDWEKAFEVRDKHVSFSDVQVFAKKCADMGVREPGYRSSKRPINRAFSALLRTSRDPSSGFLNIEAHALPGDARSKSLSWCIKWPMQNPTRHRGRGNVDVHVG
jgi:hypothetical protein